MDTGGARRYVSSSFGNHRLSERKRACVCMCVFTYSFEETRRGLTSRHYLFYRRQIRRVAAVGRECEKKV